MPRQQHFHGLNHLHYLTTRTYRRFAWCQRMLDRVKLPATVHDHADFRVWQRKFYDMNIWSEKKKRRPASQVCGLFRIGWKEPRTQRTGPRYPLHAPEPGEAAPGGEAGRLALVELEIPLSGRCVDTRHGSDAVIRYWKILLPATSEVADIKKRCLRHPRRSMTGRRS